MALVDSPQSLKLHILLALVLFYARYTIAACLTPNGTDRNSMFGAADGWYYAPCDNVAEFSMCCAIGPGRSSSKDRCRWDGLCETSGGMYYRESCTDPSWVDPACKKLYVNGTGINGTDVTLRKCEDAQSQSRLTKKS